jgi:hypothetical protein
MMHGQQNIKLYTYVDYMNEGNVSLTTSHKPKRKARFFSFFA